MKSIFLGLGLILMAQSAQASWYEVECYSKDENSAVEAFIEMPFGQSPFRNTEMTYVVDGNKKTLRTSVTARAWMRELTYTGYDFRLEIDLWPDNAPRWGRDYSAKLDSSKLGKPRKTEKMECSFPNAF